jgi:hypothetical protein
MAKIEMTVFVEDWSKNDSKHPDWAMKTAEPHRKKDGDKWVTTSRTFRTVKAAYEVTIDFTRFAKGDRVVVVDHELTEVREHAGKKYYDLVVKADSVSLVEQSPAEPKPVTPPVDTWPTADIESPF